MPFCCLTEKLFAGKYGLEVLVYDDEGNYGRDFVNITVRLRPEPHVNKAPIVIISPSTNITMKPSDKLVLDASSKRRNSRRRRVKYAILDHNREEGIQSRMFAKDKSSLIVSETETEILFESKKKGGGGGGGKSEKQALINQPINSNRVKNNLTESSGRSKKTLNNVS
uniref:Uncharacterized protein n=1 Tax=Amphimedon queenslandica TaxID=400682 RepID=A0A1X7THP3_AMPQE